MNPLSNTSKERAIQVLTGAFRDIPGALWILKKDKQIQERLKVLCHFCVSVAMQKQGAYLSSDNKGVALIFKSGLKLAPLKSLLGYIRLGSFCIGWSRAWEIIQREKQIVSRRPKEEHLYFWMLAVEDHTNGLNTIIEMRNFVYGLSSDLKLPIFAETTVEKNLVLYRRYGFEVYDTWDTGKQGIKVWFIRREWNSGSSSRKPPVKEYSGKMAV